MDKLNERDQVLKFMRKNYSKEATRYQYTDDEEYSIYHDGSRPKAQRKPGQSKTQTAQRCNNRAKKSAHA